MRQACDRIVKALAETLEAVRVRAEEHRRTPMIGRTHRVHAEPMTLGVKLALWYAELQRDLDRLRQPALDPRLQDHTIDDDLDRVVAAAIELDPVVERAELAVDARLREAALPQRLQLLLELALAAADDRGQHLEPGALLHLEHPVDDLLGGLPADRLAADRAVRAAGPGEEQAQVVVDLGDGPDGGAWVAAGGLLVDRDRRGEPLDEVDVGLVHLAEELPGVGGQRLDVAALPLRIDRVEGEAGLAGAGEARDDDESVPRDGDRDILEVVLPRA